MLGDHSVLGDHLRFFRKYEVQNASLSTVSFKNKIFVHVSLVTVHTKVVLESLKQVNIDQTLAVWQMEK